MTWIWNQSLDASSLIDLGAHFFPPEVWNGEQYCWSSPRAAVMLSIGSAECWIRMNACPTGGWLVRNPKVFLDGARIPFECVTETDGIVNIFVRSDLHRASGDVLLSWKCDPFIPAASGLPDYRKLGIALTRIELKKVVAANTSQRSVGVT